MVVVVVCELSMIWMGRCLGFGGGIIGIVFVIGFVIGVLRLGFAIGKEEKKKKRRRREARRGGKKGRQGGTRVRGGTGVREWRGGK